MCMCVVCVYVSAYTYLGVQVEVRDQLAGISFLLLSCGSWEWTKVTALVASSFIHWAIMAAPSSFSFFFRFLPTLFFSLFSAFFNPSITAFWLLYPHLPFYISNFTSSFFFMKKTLVLCCYFSFQYHSFNLFWKSWKTFSSSCFQVITVVNTKATCPTIWVPPTAQCIWVHDH